MRANNVKRHMSLKQQNVNSTLHQPNCHLECVELTYEAQHNNQPLVEGCKEDDFNDPLVSYTANLKFELQRNDGSVPEEC